MKNLVLCVLNVSLLVGNLNVLVSSPLDRRGTWPKIAQMGTRRRATDVREKDTLPWIAQAARGS